MAGTAFSLIIPNASAHPPSPRLRRDKRATFTTFYVASIQYWSSSISSGGTGSKSHSFLAKLGISWRTLRHMSVSNQVSQVSNLSTVFPSVQAQSQGILEFFGRDARCMGMTQPRSPCGGTFLRTAWLPRWRATKNPSRCSALTASVPDTMGSLAMRQFKRADRGWLFQGLRE